ncbi:MAG TPA: hypothetical protein VLA13_06545 [Massilibacterium sp.]|nr:hypothetical protein [Massilibacterium sp.]
MSVWDTREKLDYVFSDDFGVDEIKSEGVSVRVGNKLVKLKVSEEQILPEDEIKNELKAEFEKRISDIKKVCDEKITEMFHYVQQERNELEEKEEELERLLSETSVMPNITYEHAKRGLSIVKDNQSNNKYIWFYQGVYWPKTVDGNQIKFSYTKKLITPVTIQICTTDDKITSISLRNHIGLGKFDHYHRLGNDDCWGFWKYPSDWKTPDDIINCAEKALAVLDNINTYSIGVYTPKGLPRLSTLKKHVVSGHDENDNELKLSKEIERAGVSANINESSNGSIWTA